MAEGAELYEVGEELLVHRFRQRQRDQFRWVGQGQREAACGQEAGSTVEEASGSPVSVFWNQLVLWELSALLLGTGVAVSAAVADWPEESSSWKLVEVQEFLLAEC